VHVAKLDGGGDPLARQAGWRELMAKWLKGRGVPPTWLWWREHGALAGEHVHLLLHLPAGHRKAFARMVERNWVQEGEPGAIDLRPANGDRSMIGYALKDLEKRDWLALNLSHGLWRTYAHKRSRKPIIGKRCGTSENIGATARRRYYARFGLPVAKAA